MRDRPDDVLGSPGRVAAEENSGTRRLERRLVDGRHAPLVELDPHVALDPGEGVFLADRQDHVVGGQEHFVDHVRFLRLGVPFQPLELHALQHAVFDHEALGRVIDDDLDAFFLGVVQFPRRGFEESARAARHHLDIFAAQPARGPAAIHGGVADADDQNPLADLVDVPEGDRFQPVDADVDAVGIVAAGQISSLPRGAPVPTKTASKPSFSSAFRLLDRRVVADVDAHVENRADLVVQHFFRQPERRNVGAHQPAGLVVLFEDGDFVAERQQIVGDGERCRARRRCSATRLPFFVRGSSEGDAEISPRRSAATRFSRQIATGLPSRRPRRQAGSHGRSQVRPENRRETRWTPGSPCRRRCTALRDQADVLGNVGVRGTGPLAIHYFVEVIRVANVASLQSLSPEI